MANPEIVLVCNPPLGESFSVRTTVFQDLEEARLEVERAIEKQGPLTFPDPKEDRDATERLVLNLAALTSVRITSGSGEAGDTGQYL